jgi:hypothetical protein
VKPDEVELLKAAAAGERPRDAGERLGIHPRRVGYVCGKWADRGWYEYGVAADLGWLTEAGRAALAGRR